MASRYFEIVVLILLNLGLIFSVKQDDMYRHGVRNSKYMLCV